MAANTFAIQNPEFYPAFRLVTAITQSNPVSVTTSFPHGYQSGLVMRLSISYADGMPQINNMVGPITVTSPTTFTMPIDSTLFYPFNITQPAHKNTCSLVIPVGEINSTLYQATQNVLT